MSEPLLAVPLADVSDAALVAELRRRGGYRIDEDDGSGWITPALASRQAGFHSNWLTKLLQRGTRPPGLEYDRGNGGRLVKVRPSSSFHQWAAARRDPQPSLAL